MVHKIPISPVVEMAKHWIWASSQPRRWAIEFTSVVTKLCARLNLLTNFDRYITTPRVVLHKRFYIQGQYLKGGANNSVFLKVYNTHETILLPYEELKIYSGNPLLPMCKRHMRHVGPPHVQDHELQVMMMTVTMREVLVGCRRPIRDTCLVPTVAVCLVLLCRIHSPVLNALTWTC